MKVIVRAQVNQTEDRTKVLTALENIFPGLEFKPSKNRSALEAAGAGRNDLAEFKEHLKIQLIRDTARAFLRGKIAGNKLYFELNKQAAYVGKVSFVDFPIALGSIAVDIEEDDMEGLVDWLTDANQKTTSGKLASRASRQARLS